jgi:hypothetical protein
MCCYERVNAMVEMGFDNGEYGVCAVVLGKEKAGLDLFL